MNLNWSRGCSSGCRLQQGGPHPAAVTNCKQHHCACCWRRCRRHAQLHGCHWLWNAQHTVQAAAAAAAAGPAAMACSLRAAEWRMHHLYGPVCCFHCHPQAGARLRSIKTAGACCYRCSSRLAVQLMQALQGAHWVSAGWRSAAAAAASVSAAAPLPQLLQRRLQRLRRRRPLRAAGRRATAGASRLPCTARGTPPAPPSSGLRGGRRLRTKANLGTVTTCTPANRRKARHGAEQHNFSTHLARGPAGAGGWAGSTAAPLAGCRPPCMHRVGQGCAGSRGSVPCSATAILFKARASLHRRRQALVLAAAPT